MKNKKIKNKKEEKVKTNVFNMPPKSLRGKTGEQNVSSEKKEELAGIIRDTMAQRKKEKK